MIGNEMIVVFRDGGGDGEDEDVGVGGSKG